MATQESAEDSEFERLHKELSRTADRLGEHFSSVAIFATKMSEDGEGNVVSFSAHSGNFYATQGLVVEWLEAQKERIRIKVRNEGRNDE